MATPKHKGVKGLTISAADYDFLSELLTRLALQAKQDNRTDIYSRLNRFIVRLKQAVHAGDGVPEDVMRRLTNVVQEAFSRGDFPAAHNGLSAMVAAVVRQDPDPGVTIAHVIAPSLVLLVQQSAQAHHLALASGVAAKMHEHLKKERVALAESGWTEPQLKSYDYVLTMIAFFGEQLEAGSDPFVEAASDPEQEKPS